MTTPEEKRLLVQDALGLLTGAFMRLQKPQHWSGRAYALDGRGRPVRVDDPRAARFCLMGALLRAEHDQHGTAMPIQTSADPEVDDLLEPVLPPDAPARLILACDVLAAASFAELERLGVSFVERTDAEVAAAGTPALTRRQLPLLLGLHRRARHRTNLRALYRAAAALAIALGYSKNIFDGIADEGKATSLDAVLNEGGAYLHRGRHVAQEGDQKGEFPVDHADARFALTLTRLLVGEVARLTSDGFRSRVEVDARRQQQRGRVQGRARDPRLRQPPQLRAVAMTPEQVSVWADRELERLRPREQARLSAYDLTAMMTRETRTADEFKDEVRQYATQVPTRYQLLARKQAVDTRLATVALVVENPTEINFAKTQVTLRLPGDVLAYFDSDDLDSDLGDCRPPVPWGKHTIHHSIAIVPRLGGILQNLRPDGRKIDSNGGEVVVTLPPVDVRPGTTHELEPIYLVIPDSYVGKTVEVAWRATSTGAAGDADGTLEADVVDAVDADELVAAAEVEE